MLQMREEEKKKQEQEDAEKAKIAQKEKQEEERAEEEEKRRKEEKERKEEEEYRKLAESFIVDEEGFDETNGGESDSENQLQVFIQYIKVILLNFIRLTTGKNSPARYKTNNRQIMNISGYKICGIRRPCSAF